MAEHNYKRAEELLEQALLCTNCDQSILSLRAQNFAAMGRYEECLQALSTMSDAELSSADLKLKARSEFTLHDYVACVADYLKVVNLNTLTEPADIINLAKALLETGEPIRAQAFLNKIEADDKLLRQCKQAQIDKLQSDLRHALVKKAN
jgi:thioredoxin-like negative regulator of GroEL